MPDLFLKVKRLLESDKKMKRSQSKKAKNAPQQKLDTSSVNGSVKSDKPTAETREMERREREKIVLWRSPITTVQYFLLEASVLFTILCGR